MSQVGWEALGQWGDDVARIEPIAGRVANDVWSVRVHGHVAVGRLGARSDADLRGKPGSSNTSTVKVWPCQCRSRRRTAGCSRTVSW
jgi:hypothetical protein